jgi:chitodextrinase
MTIPAILLVLVLVVGVSPAAAAFDRKKPTTPTNLQVTGKTSSSVSLAWNPSTDNSGVFSYVIHVSDGKNVPVGQTATSFTVTGLSAGYTHSFYIYALDGSGNKSGNSNTVSTTLPADNSPPTAPVLSLVEAGPTHVRLAWTASTDDGNYIWYQVFKDSQPVYYAYSNLSATIKLLQPETTYTFNVRAGDTWSNLSPFRNNLVVTTPASDPNDTTPPTTPANFNVSDNSCGEVGMNWVASTDNVDAAEFIIYDIYVNDVFDHSVAGVTGTITYGTINGLNTFKIIARDAAGNSSAPATDSITLDLCF